MAAVDMSSLKPNSNAYKNSQKMDSSISEEKKENLAPIVNSSGVVSTKKPLRKKFAESFLNDDVSDIKSYIVMDVLIPGIKTTILDIISMAFFNETYDRRGKSGNGRRDDRGGSRIYYSKMYDGGSSRSSSRSSYNRKGRDYEGDDDLDYRNIILYERRDAERVVDELKERINKQGSASIANLFNLIDVPSKYVDENWGWTDDRDIGLRRVSNGWLIDVAKAIYLD